MPVARNHINTLHRARRLQLSKISLTGDLMITGGAQIDGEVPMANRWSSLAVAALLAISMPFANIASAMPVAGALAHVKSATPTNIETVQWRGGGYYGGGYYGRGW